MMSQNMVETDPLKIQKIFQSEIWSKFGPLRLKFSDSPLFLITHQLIKYKYESRQVQIREVAIFRT